ncbi:MAG: hypothetical protein ACR2P4_05725 [Gammaproteobacteria bacterium]
MTGFLRGNDEKGGNDERGGNDGGRDGVWRDGVCLWYNGGL